MQAQDTNSQYKIQMGRIVLRYDSFIKIMKKGIIQKIRRIIIITLPVWGIIAVNVLTNMHLKHFCLIKWLTNHECFGCGMTRAFAALSRLDFKGAYEYNHLVIVYAPLAVIIWLLLLYYEFKHKHQTNTESNSE